jgi:hypothetical protein
MDICVDFDGTCVTHEYPNVGREIGASSVLKELIDNGHRLILFTMRSDSGSKKVLSDAIDWFTENDIQLYGIQTHPKQSKWTSSPKAYGQIYIDDAALGCPLVYPKGERPYVDWKKVRDILVEMEVIKS